ncbi:MAG: 2-phosphosulfolactate phosphatase [Isosphaeraceae bacterium]|nr:2-phosphosulfolactate phosphatase [Isosphaeraceae bacterium]
MSELERPEVYVYLLPILVPAGALKGGVAVVVDVLRATTVMVHALAAGCESVIPCLEIEDARRTAGSLPPGRALLAGERKGLPIPGFDLGNSPEAFTPAACGGRTVVMTTTNGTRALLASLEAERVVVGAFPNFAATVQLLHGDHRPIHVVCAGTDGFVSYEDSLLAGAYAKHFKDLGATLRNDEAEVVAGLWARVEDSIWVKSGDRAAEKNPLVRYLTRGRGGQRVLELGLGADIDAAARFNSLEPRLAAELKRDPLRIVAVGH